MILSAGSGGGGMIKFIIGFIIGMMVGVMMMALCVAASRADKDLRK